MLDPGGHDSSFSRSPKGFVSADPLSFQNDTVKELLMRRQAHPSGQTWSRSEDDSSSEHHVKCLETGAFAVPVNPHTSTQCAAAAAAPYPPGHPALQGQEVAPQVKGTLFQWQIQQELQKTEGLSPELLNMQDADGDTCLHIAVAQGRRALSYVLAAKMAGCGSLEMREHNGQTALQIAAATNQHLIVLDLLQHGAHIHTRDLWGRSPLHVCAEKGHFLSLQSVWRTLTGSGQSIDTEMFNYDGFTPLHAAVLSHNAVVKETRCLEKPCPYVMMELVQRRQMYAECVNTLLLMGASCGTKDLKSGRTCLHMAAEEANVELFQIFLDQPTSLSVINVKTFSGNTALHIICSLQNHQAQVEAVKLLMRRGADPGTRNLENELPSQLVPEGPAGEKVRQILRGKRVRT